MSTVVQRDPQAMEQYLAVISGCLKSMQQLLSRMGEHCDPYIYYKRVRLPMSGWKNNPALPMVSP
jgi:indoleamine 2,3-dioxygenase